MEDHIHVILGCKPTIAVSKAVQLLKGASSKWIHESFPTLLEFAWQDGYAAFTVSKSSLPRALEYVEQQREHHQTQTFQEEYKAFLDNHEIEYDERYLWD